MWTIKLFVIMILLHIIADYNLQGILANMKQKSWWEMQIRDFKCSKYRNDYKMALIVHSFEWSVIIMLPMLLLSFANPSKTINISYIVCLFLNTCIHYYIDDLKANRETINLVCDQCIHALQILLTALYWTILFNWEALLKWIA